ncbi:hypothetical protein ACTQ29_05935 [Bifidobacterium boum]|uniref:hypothetical protein n=1 Tax=Bifidobacterium boum TaxID=78343 RepID=UPI003F935B85
MSQIRIVSINREKDRFLVCPFVMSWGINRVTDRFFASLKGPGVTAGDVGVALLDSFAFIERTGPLELSLEEQENFWRHDTKYRTYRAFVRNNDLVEVTNYKDKEYWVYAYPPRIGDDWDDEVWKGTVPAGASAEELGDAVMDAYAAIDEWKKAHGRRAGGREPVARSVALCDGGEVLLPGPGEGFAERTSAAGEVLLAFERRGGAGIPWRPCTWPRRSGTRRRTAGRRGTSGWSAGRRRTGLRARSRASRAGRGRSRAAGRRATARV